MNLSQSPQPQQRQDMSKWRRRMEANLDLALNYCRAIAARHLTPEQIQYIEESHRRREERIEESTDPEMSDDDDADDEGA